MSVRPQISLVAALTLLVAAQAAAQSEAVLFADDFDGGNSGQNWTVRSYGTDYVADFAFDYSTRGIPSAPHSIGGSTIGLRMLANANDSTAATDAVSAYPLATNFTGDYSLKFDMWINYSGGAGGGTGSTQFSTAGVNHSGTRVVWPLNAASDGLSNAVTGEGGAADDYCAYSGPTLLSVTAGGYAGSSRNHTGGYNFYQNLFPAPPFETVGAPGKQWVQVEIRVRGGSTEWRLNDRLITIRVDTSATFGNIMLGQADTYSSIAVPSQDTFVIYDNVRVVTHDCNGNDVSDAQDIAAGTSLDCNATGVPDECETIAAGDFDGDGDVDGADLLSFNVCMDGPGLTPTLPNPSCAGAYLAAHDFTCDGFVDLADVACLQLHSTPGPFAARSASAPRAARFMAEVASLTLTNRETRITQEVLGGNVPGFLRTFVPITVTATIGGTPTTATYYVAPDYVCIGHNDDFVRVPMTPLIAQPIADALGCLLPTRKMVNDIWVAATVKLAPAPISPTYVDIMLATTHYRHNDMVEAQRQGYALGPLIAGIKKDVVITPQLLTHTNSVAIYGWHYQNGTPIQPLYLGHEKSYVDYSHGIRLVRNQMLVNGQVMSVAAVLADPSLCVLLSDEGVVTQPHY
jgi:hypothetical protein